MRGARHADAARAGYADLVPGDLGTRAAAADTIWSETFLPVPSAAAAARHFVTATLGVWGLGDLSWEASLVVSELATNAVQHGHSPFSASVSRARGVVRIAVEDVAPGRPERRAATRDLLDGRGVAIVEALTSRSGCDILPDSKVVWAELSTGPRRGRLKPHGNHPCPRPVVRRMTTLADRTIAALRGTHDQAAAHVRELSMTTSSRTPPAPPGWPVAQVLSHLGSGAEIALAGYRAALAGTAPPAIGFPPGGLGPLERLGSGRAGRRVPHPRRRARRHAGRAHSRSSGSAPRCSSASSRPRSRWRPPSASASTRPRCTGGTSGSARTPRHHRGRGRQVIAEHLADGLGFMLGFIGKADALAEPARVRPRRRGRGPGRSTSGSAWSPTTRSRPPPWSPSTGGGAPADRGPARPGAHALPGSRSRATSRSTTCAGSSRATRGRRVDGQAGMAVLEDVLPGPPVRRGSGR